jgi:hypothetical protein
MTANLNDDLVAWQPASAPVTAAGLAQDPVEHRTQKALKRLLGLLNTMPDARPPADLVSRTIARVDQESAARKPA